MPTALKDDKYLKVSTTKIYFIHSDKAAQSQIRIGYLALPYDSREAFYKAGLMNFMFGGTFNSHLNMNLRENKGWTYGVRSSFSGTKYRGPFVISGGFKKDATDSTLDEIFKELGNYTNSLLTPEEVNLRKSSINQSEALKNETLAQKANILYAKQRYQLEPDYKMMQMQILMGFCNCQILVFAKNLDIGHMVIVVVGDRKTVKSKLDRWGYEIVEMDAEGNILK